MGGEGGIMCVHMCKADIFLKSFLVDLGSFHGGMKYMTHVAMSFLLVKKIFILESWSSFPFLSSLRVLRTLFAKYGFGGHYGQMLLLFSSPSRPMLSEVLASLTPEPGCQCPLPEVTMLLCRQPLGQR